jgi:cellobiose-specific phosphotransferase system component IIA
MYIYSAHKIQYKILTKKEKETKIKENTITIYQV